MYKKFGSLIIALQLTSCSLQGPHDTHICPIDPSDEQRKCLITKLFAHSDVDKNSIRLKIMQANSDNRSDLGKYYRIRLTENSLDIVIELEKKVWWWPWRTEIDQKMPRIKGEISKFDAVEGGIKVTYIYNLKTETESDCQHRIIMHISDPSLTAGAASFFYRTDHISDDNKGNSECHSDNDGEKSEFTHQSSNGGGRN